MAQVQQAPIRTALQSHTRACTAYDRFTRGVRFAPERATYFRKLRAPSQEPNPLARVMAHISEAARAGATEAQARALAVALVEHIDAEYGHLRQWSRDLVLAAHRAENDQNMTEAELLIAADTPEALRAYATATRRAAILGLIAADAADMEASRRMGGSH